MKKTSEPIVFFGSGPVAAESLRLLAQNFVIEAIVTKPRAAHHKGSVPVLELAEILKLPVYTAENKKQLDDLFKQHPFKSRLGVLIDFGIIVSQDVIDYFPLGIINSHFSLLPEWRGADPITFSILSGQKSTGVSLMLLTAGMDEGPLLARTDLAIPANMTTPELTRQLIEQSDEALQDTIPRYLSGETKPASQEDTAKMLGRPFTPTYSRKLTKEDGVLDWSKSAAQLEREIQAFIDWPKSRTEINDLELIVTAAHGSTQQGSPGTPTIIDKKPAFFCGKDALVIDRLKPAGKKEMTGEAFLAGYKKLFLQD